MASHAKERKTKARKKTTPLVWIIPCLLLVIALGVGAWGFLRTYCVVGGQFIRRDATEADLRGKNFSPENFETLRAKLPNCHVLWSVPLSGGSFDCTAESIAPAAWSGEDIALLGYFENLQSIDVTAAELTPADYEQLAAALPEGAVRWSVPLGGERFPNDAREITLQSLSEEDLNNFQYFSALDAVDARACTDYEAILALRAQLPELNLQWSVPFSGRDYPQDAKSLTVDDPSVTVDDVAAALRYLPEVEGVNAPEAGWTEEEKTALREEYPQVTFSWPVTILGTLYPWDTTEIDLAGRALSAGDLQELAEKGVGLPYVQRLDLTGCGVGLTDEMFKLREVFPQADIVFDFELYGVPINTMDDFVDFTGVAMESTEPVESMLAFMPNLKKVDMSDCGFDDETMDALNKKYEDVRFVWTLYITYYTIRTDAVSFRATSRHYGTFDEESVKRLKYCEDMICMDMGHRRITDISFLYGMPKLKYLCLLDCRADDLTPIGSLQELIWLELNRASGKSIAPLANCPNLHDLNMTFMDYTNPQENFETLMAMPQLERVWFSRPLLTDDQIAELQAKYPDTVYHMVYTWVQSNENPWRFDQDYYDMRDVMNMFYMDESGYISYKIIDGVRYDLDPEFLASQGNTDHDRDRTQQ